MQGSIPGHENRYDLDQEHSFETGRPALVCGNTAAMLGEGGKSWLAPHFQAASLSFPYHQCSETRLIHIFVSLLAWSSG